MQRTRSKLRALLVLLVLAFSATVGAQGHNNGVRNGNTANLPSTIWRHADNVGSMNLLYGSGGQAHAPDANGRYTFVEEIVTGTSPKFDIRDAQGVQWRVKMGHESHSEVAATRLLWAAGYLVDEDYYLPTIKVIGLPKLRRGGKFVSSGGIVRGVRLERRLQGAEKIKSWSWFDNPFLDKRELNGLRVMMSLLNNWDLKKDNNTVEEMGGELRYVVTDLGATFGKTGNSFGRSRSVLKDYERSKFIKKVTPEYVDFVMNSRPVFLTAILPYYYRRARMEKITRRVPRADVQWLAQRLSQLSEGQIRDSFLAAGYTPQEIEGYTRTVQKRIAELNAL